MTEPLGLENQFWDMPQETEVDGMSTNQLITKL
jgi:predicted DNA-binding ribbon-helix-helix protein